MGRYAARFKDISSQLVHYAPGSRVLELCFGDTYIAEFCKAAGHQWIGLDINQDFIRHAQNLGFNARYEDLFSAKNFPKADVCIMMGSLYHFHHQADCLLEKILSAANTFILSEPVLNLSARKGFIGFLAKRAANAGKGNEPFRYNAATLMSLLEASSRRLNYTIDSVTEKGKDVIVKITKNGTTRP
jgi:SAM-dependent methyltransferase